MKLNLVIGKFYKSNSFGEPRFYRYDGNESGKSWVADVYNCTTQQNETIDNSILHEEVHPSQVTWHRAYPNHEVCMQKIAEYVPEAMAKAESMTLL